jgi:Protein of unknown function (DUF732)
MGFAAVGGKALIVGAVIAAVPLIAAAPVHADQADDAFIEALNSNEVPYKTPEDAIRIAKKVRTLLGESPGQDGLKDAVKYMSKYTNYSQEQIGLFGGAAIGAYCPENNPNQAAPEG